MKEYKRKYKSKAKRIVWYKKQQCAEKGIPFDLDGTWAYKRLSKGCELTGIPFELDVDGSISLYSPSIDRIDPTKGYTKDNCRLILNSLNCFKGTGTDEHIFQIAEALLNPYKPNISTDEQLRYELEFHFTNKQIDVIMKRKNGERITKTDKEYYSRIIKKRLKKLSDMNIEWVKQLL